MNVRMLVLAVSMVALAACSPRQVEVRTAASQPAQVSVQVTNNLATSVNVYATSGGTDTFLRQVSGNASATIPMPGFAAGSSVTFKAVTIDGATTYSRANITLNGTYVFTLP